MRPIEAMGPKSLGITFFRDEVVSEGSEKALLEIQNTAEHDVEYFLKETGTSGVNTPPGSPTLLPPVTLCMVHSFPPPNYNNKKKTVNYVCILQRKRNSFLPSIKIIE